MKRNFAPALTLIFLVLAAAIPWLTGAIQNSSVPVELVMQPTAYQLKRATQQTATAQADAKAAPTPEATVFDAFNQPEVTTEVNTTQTPQP